MAKIVITSTPKTVKVAFNDYSEKVGLKCGSYLRNEISEVNEHHNADHLTVVMLDGSDFDLSFDLFPNPTQDQLNIELNQPTEQKLSFQIFDVTGKLVQEVQFTKNNSYLKEQVDVSRLAAGSYEVLLSDGEMFGRGRFVKM